MDWAAVSDFDGVLFGICDLFLLAPEQKALGLIDATSECDFVYFQGPVLHAESSAKPAILLCTPPASVPVQDPELSGTFFLLQLQSCCSQPRRRPVFFKMYQSRT